MQTPWLIATDDPAGRTLLLSLTSEAVAADPEFIKRDGRGRYIQFVERDPSADGVLWKDANIDAASVVEVAIGDSNTPPTSGTFALSFDGNSTGLTALAYNISAANLQTALNANAAIVTAGSVDVTKGATDGDYIVAFRVAGARNLIVIDEGTLAPPCVVNVAAVQEGDGSTKEVQNITFKQQPLAYSNDFSASSSGSIAVTVNQAGSATQPSIQTIAITPNVIDGTFTAQATQAQVVKVTAAGSTGICAKFQIVLESTVTGLNSKFIDLFDASGPVRVWFDFNSTGVAPPTPTGGRLVEVDSATDTATAWTNALASEFAADAGFDIVSGVGGIGYGITLAVKTLVDVSEGEDYGITGLTVNSTPVAFPAIDQQGFIVYDGDGSVGVWINLSAAAEEPEGLADVNRLIQVTSITSTSSGAIRTFSATNIASGISTAVDADAAFTSSASSGTVTITNASVGPREEPEQISPILGVSQTTAGYTLAGSFACDAEAGDLANVFGEFYTVTKNDVNSWQLVALTNGTNATITADDTNLVFAPVFAGTLILNTWNMALAFQATTSDEIDSTLEVQITEPGGEPIKVLNIPCSIRRDVIEGEPISNASSSSVTGANVFHLGGVDDYLGGTSADLDGQPTAGVPVPRLYFFIHATEGLRGYLLRAGTDAESSPAIIRPDDYNGATNAKVWQSVI